MKYSLFFCCLPLLLFAQKKEQTAQEDFENLLKASFYGNTTFVHHEYDEIIPQDTLSYTFYAPEVNIKNDTLFLSYMQRLNEYGGIIIEKIELIITLNCVDYLSTLQFTFGATDRFEPALPYLGFWMLKKDCAKQNNYYLDNALWESQQYSDSDFELQFTDAPFVPKFPVKLSQRKLKKLQQYFKKIANASD